MKYAYIIHGWSGSTREPLHQWIARELASRGYQVAVPEMPDPDHPVIESWVGKLNEVITTSPAETLLIGHSIGCQALIRYLEHRDRTTSLQEGLSHEETQPFAKMILIAPWLTLQNLDDDESPSIARPWLETPIDTERVRRGVQKIHAFLSDNDPYVPLIENEEFCKTKLGAEIIILHDRGHFTESDHIDSLPELLDYV